MSCSSNAGPWRWSFLTEATTQGFGSARNGACFGSTDSRTPVDRQASNTASSRRIRYTFQTYSKSLISAPFSPCSYHRRLQPCCSHGTGPAGVGSFTPPTPEPGPLPAQQRGPPWRHGERSAVPVHPATSTTLTNKLCCWDWPRAHKEPLPPSSPACPPLPDL